MRLGHSSRSESKRRSDSLKRAFWPRVDEDPRFGDSRSYLVGIVQVRQARPLVGEQPSEQSAGQAVSGEDDLHICQRLTVHLSLTTTTSTATGDGSAKMTGFRST